MVAVTLVAGVVTDIPPIRVARLRVKGELTGELGFDTHDQGPSADLDQVKHVVSVVLPNGPAAKSGLRVGDEIVSVDGHDVVGPNGYLYFALSRVPEGTTLNLGLRSGRSVLVRAERPHPPNK
jgi:C-terminal processing protease CtpA/Prc